MSYETELSVSWAWLFGGSGTEWLLLFITLNIIHVSTYLRMLPYSWIFSRKSLLTGSSSEKIHTNTNLKLFLQNWLN